MSNTQIVKEIYAAFMRGDVATILNHLADDVIWEYDGTPEVPWLVPRRGKDGAAAFFAALAVMDIYRFEVKAVLGEGKLVVDVVDIDFTVRTTGKRVVEIDEVHLWHFNDAGKVARFRHRGDTLLQWRALSA